MTTGIVPPATDGQIGFAEDIKQLTDVLTGQMDGGALSLLGPLATPGAPTTSTSLGSINGSGYQWGVYWISGTQTKNQSAVTVNNIVGRTPYGTLTSPQTITNKRVSVSISSLTPPAGTIGWGVVRNVSGGSSWFIVPSSEQFLTGGSLPSAFIDTHTDATLGSTPGPTTNTTGTTLSFYNPNAYGTAFPASPLAGQQFWLVAGNTTIPFIYDGTHWYSSPVAVLQFGNKPASGPSTSSTTNAQIGTISGPVYITDAIAAGCTVQLRLDAELLCAVDGDVSTAFPCYSTTGVTGHYSDPPTWTYVTGAAVSSSHGTLPGQAESGPWAAGASTGDQMIVSIGANNPDAAGVNVGFYTVWARFRK